MIIFLIKQNKILQRVINESINNQTRPLEQAVPWLEKVRKEIILANIDWFVGIKLFRFSKIITFKL